MKHDGVAIRERVVSNGTRSLYLDIYWRGRRKRERLGLYLVAELTAADKRHNKEIMEVAEHVREMRAAELRAGTYNFLTELSGDVDFVSFCRKHIEGRDKTVRPNLNSTLRWVIAYGGESVKTSEITPEWVEDWLELLDENLSPNTVVLYYQRLRELLDCCVRARIISQNPAKAVKCPSREDTHREYLTLDELRRIAEVDSSSKLSRAFLFSCLTGLRFSDIKKLTWGEVARNDRGGVRLVFRQKKTGGLEYLDINSQAAELMGERGDADSRVFLKLDNGLANQHIARCAQAAGVNKHITFHCGRHTFATLQLSLDTDIYTLSKLLGHRNVRTTQVYAKVLDKKKQEAVEKIPDIF